MEEGGIKKGRAEGEEVEEEERVGGEVERKGEEEEEEGERRAATWASEPAVVLKFGIVNAGGKRWGAAGSMTEGGGTGGR